MSATAKVVNDIAQALDSKLDCVALFIDLSKAFDSVDHTILLERLHNIGLDYKSCKWVENYLSGRSQAVIGDGFHIGIFKYIQRGTTGFCFRTSVIFYSYQ